MLGGVLVVLAHSGSPVYDHVCTIEATPVSLSSLDIITGISSFDLYNMEEQESTTQERRAISGTSHLLDS